MRIINNNAIQLMQLLFSYCPISAASRMGIMDIILKFFAIHWKKYYLNSTMCVSYKDIFLQTVTCEKNQLLITVHYCHHGQYFFISQIKPIKAILGKWRPVFLSIKGNNSVSKEVYSFSYIWRNWNHCIHPNLKQIFDTLKSQLQNQGNFLVQW